MDPNAIQSGTPTPLPVWGAQLSSISSAEPAPFLLPPTVTQSQYADVRSDSRSLADILNQKSDSVLGAIAEIGAWADRNIPQDDVLDVAAAIPGGVASTQQSLYQTGQLLGESEGVASYMSELSPSRFTGMVAKAGAAFDAVTGLLDVARAVKQDRDAGDPLYSQTLKASAVSTASISLGSVAGMAASTFLIGVSASVSWPVIAGGALGAGVAYGAKKILNWL